MKGVAGESPVGGGARCDGCLGRAATADCSAKQTSASAGERRERAAQAVRCFAEQLARGCGGGECAIRFCRGNQRYAQRLAALGRGELDALAVELARRALERPDVGELQPHTPAQLAVADSVAPQRACDSDEEGGGFAQAYARSIRRLVGWAQPAAPRPARGDCVADAIAARPEALDAHKLGSGDGAADQARSPAPKTIMTAAAAVRQPDPPPPQPQPQPAQTGSLVAKLGGSSVELVFQSPAALGQCFAANGDAAAAFGVDVAAAAAFMEEAASDEQTRATAVSALQRCLATIEGQLARTTLLPADVEDVAGRALAIGTLFVAAGRSGTAALQRRMGRLIVRLVYRDGLLQRAPAVGWHGAFVRDSAQRRQWVEWWAAAPAAAARQWVQALRYDAEHACAELHGGLTSALEISDRLYADPVRWAGALELLRLLWEANERAADGSGRGADEALDADEFRSERLLAQFALGDETRRWMDGLRRRAGEATASTDQWTPAGLDVFNPLMYPFVFGIAAAREVHTAEAHERMRQRYLGAHARQADLLQYQRLLNIDGRAERAVRPLVAPGWPLLSSNLAAVAGVSNPYLVLSVRRSKLVPDAMDMLGAGLAGERARFPLKVRFVAGGEDGIDMGGVQKELYAALVPQLLAPERGLFALADGGDGGVLWPNAASPHALHDFELVGALLGLAFVNGIALGPVPLAPLLIQQLAFGGAGLAARAAGWPLPRLAEAARATFPRLVAGLQQLLDWDEQHGAVEDVFCRSFDVTVPDPLHMWQPAAAGSAAAPAAVDRASSTATFALGPDPAEPVTGTTRHRYVRRYLEFVAFEHVRPQMDALRRGFARAADGLAYRLIGPAELERRLCGSAAPLDAAALERIAGYEDEYAAGHPVVRRFWRVVHAMTQPQLRQLLAFVTAADRLPLDGYAGVTFVVQRNGPDSDRLPTALTCFGRLLLPAYRTEDRLRERLLTAIENASGFGLV